MCFFIKRTRVLTVDLDPQTTQNAYWKDKIQLLESLQGKIKRFLMYVGSAGDPAAWQLLKETMKLLEAQKRINNEKAKTSNLNNILKNIQLSLAKIKRKEPISMLKNYAAITVQNSSTSNMITAMSHKTPKPKQAPQSPTPKKVRCAREITVHIGNKAGKEKIRMLSIKYLIEALQAETKKIWGISHLISGDIKIHTESLEAKKALQDKSRWIQKVAELATVQVQTFFFRANGIKIKNIDITNQAKTIEHLQITNVRLHLGLKITKLAWSIKAIREKKTYSTLHIEITIAAMANWLIIEDLIENYKIKDCEWFTR